MRIINLKSYAALYCRLSKDDEQEGESTSISSQKLILEQYCKEKKLEIFDYYIDDGFSGLSYDRPAFLQLLDDIDAGKINLVSWYRKYPNKKASLNAIMLTDFILNLEPLGESQAVRN